MIIDSIAKFSFICLIFKFISESKYPKQNLSKHNTNENIGD